ncbi:protein transporter SEC24 [Ascobolus immersus RN42]|uniref:Protein transport protein SEC24 n=1 Tax=Ascobolus immersus RN42 TaxID=1160509 RepID=A0A3N4IGE1_ASCIM|nr:protein transporter SEC24 [Ascobolus immersus RN42]
MSAPPPGPPYDQSQYQYPPANQYGEQSQYGQQPVGYGQPPNPASPPPSQAPPAHGGPPSHQGPRGKRQYAEQAYDFAAGANAGVAATGGYPAAGGPAGYMPDTAGVNAIYGQQPQQLPGQPQAVGGYQAPQASYDPNQLAGQFGQMGLGGGAPAPVGKTVLNPLVPVDLMHNPFNPASIDLPPPPIILPPNTSVTPSPHANCPPSYMRSTLNVVPTTHNLLKKSKLPFALVVQPYNSLHDSEAPVPLISDFVISRCRRCRSYINPYVSFLDHGHRWRCNMCGLTNDVPQAFDWNPATQETSDRWQRPELNHAVVEFIAPQEYMVRPPQPLVYLFLLDVSYAAVTSGLLATAARTILESLDRIPNADKRTRLGFIAVDSALHYFSIPRDSTEPSMLVVSDLDEPFLPIPGDLLVPLEERREGIESLLSKLQEMFQDTQNAGSCMGSALQSAHKLISAVGGKVVVLTASLPNLGAGKLEMREDKKLLGTNKENGLLQTGNSFYKSFAVECSKNQVSVDMFLFSSGYQDVASLANLPRYTGGQTYFYPGWSAARSEDAYKFAKEFSDHLSSEIALEAVMRVRATTGLRMSTFYGNFFNRSSDLCAFPAFPRDQGYVVEVAIDEAIARPVVYMQTAVLHTTCNGERRIRVMTMALPTTQNLADVYASADQVAITTYFSHKAVEKALSSGLEAARDSLHSKIVELLVTYKKELTASHVGAATPLQFPANLHGLVVLFLGLMKHIGLRKSVQIPSDLRSAALALLSTLPAQMLMQYIHPKFYSLHDMDDACGLPHPETGEIVMPPPLPLSSEYIQPHGLYLIDDSQTQFIYVGGHAVPQLIEDVFGLPGVEHLKVGKGSLPILENDFNTRVRAVVDKSKDMQSKGVGSIIVPNLYIVRSDGEPSLRLWAHTMLVEDKADQGVSLQQFLGALREKVNNS